MIDPWPVAAEVIRRGHLPPIPAVAGSEPVPVAVARRGGAGAVMLVVRGDEGDFEIHHVLLSRHPDGSWPEPDSGGGWGDFETAETAAWFARPASPIEDGRFYGPGVCCVVMLCPAGVTRLRATDAWGSSEVEVSPVGLALVLTPVGSRLELTFGAGYPAWSLFIADELDGIG